MMNKREFLAGAAAVAAAAAGRAGWASQVHDVDLVIYNERYADARAFAQVHADRGVAVLPVEGDAGVLWYSKVRAMVRGGKLRIAGVGTHTDHFILQTLGRESGMKVRSATRLKVSHDGPGLVSWVMS
jgi:hypothetical protein